VIVKLTTPPTLFTLSAPLKDALLAASIRSVATMLYCTEYEPLMVATVMSGAGTDPAVFTVPVTNEIGTPAAVMTNVAVGDEKPGMLMGLANV
jgi:hypothetical protein